MAQSQGCIDGLAVGSPCLPPLPLTGRSTGLEAWVEPLSPSSLGSELESAELRLSCLRELGLCKLLKGKEEG